MGRALPSSDALLVGGLNMLTLVATEGQDQAGSSPVRGRRATQVDSADPKLHQVRIGTGRIGDAAYHLVAQPRVEADPVGCTLEDQLR